MKLIQLERYLLKILLVSMDLNLSCNLYIYTEIEDSDNIFICYFIL